MRRKDKALQIEDVQRLLREGEYGFLSTVDSDQQPYGVPLNYIYMNECVYFHCALEGQKLENIALNDKVSFCVVGHTSVIPAEFSTEFESVIACGSATVIHGEERYRALMGLAEKYSPGFVDEAPAYIKKFDSRTAVVKISIDTLTGKGTYASG